VTGRGTEGAAEGADAEEGAGGAGGRRSLRLPSGGTVAAELLRPAAPRALLVLAHGAGAGMDHPFLVAVARGLLERGVATFRYNFPYMEGRGWPPDRAPVLVETVRAAVAEAAARLPGVPLFAGGRSLGGRMTSTAAAEGPALPGVRGLVLLAFPLHPRGKPATERARHLAEVGRPVLVVQGSRDDRGDPARLRQALATVRPAAAIHVVEGADHGFQVRKRSGRTEAEVREEVAGAVADWVRAQLG
jgi:hypothetical protein